MNPATDKALDDAKLHSQPGTSSSAMPVYTLHADWIELDALAARRDALAGYLSNKEAAQAERFHAERDRFRYIARHGWLRERLSARLGAAPAEINLTQDRFGKPHVIGARLGFSLSHSRGVALLVIGSSASIGCDIEWCNAAFDGVGVAARFFSQRERAALASLPVADQQGAFYHIWTCKEAYTKAVGRGLSMPLDSFEVALDPREQPGLLRDCAGWSGIAFEPLQGFQAAVVAPGAWELVLPTP